MNDATLPRARPPAPPPGMEYPFTDAPAPAEAVPVAQGVFWLRMPLPFALDHINLWLLEDGDGWTIVDTGICSKEVQDLWRRLFAGAMAGRPVRRVVVTHFHPDHIGLAGWLGGETGAPVWATQTEWLMATALFRDTEGENGLQQLAFYHENGLSAEWLEALGGRGNKYRELVSAPPAAYRRLIDGEEFIVGPHRWRVIVGTGHAPEHACLYCPDLKVLISGDQILPRITPNVSLFAAEPEADPLALFLASLDRFAGLPADTLVLPSHGYPFRGLHARTAALKRHHDERLAEILGACDGPRSAADIVPVLFRRELDAHQIAFAMGESLSHLAHLAARGDLVRERGPDGIQRFRRADG